MADEKFLTKQDLMEALQNLATKEDVRQSVGEEIEARGLATKDDLEAMEMRTDGKLTALEAHLTREFKDYVGQAADTILKTVDEFNKRASKRFDKVEGELKLANRRLLGLEQDTVSKKEFAALKTQVEIHTHSN